MTLCFDAKRSSLPSFRVRSVGGRAANERTRVGSERSVASVEKTRTERTMLRITRRRERVEDVAEVVPAEEEEGGGGGGGTDGRGRGEKNDNHRHFNNMQRYSRLPRRASVATMALYNDKDTPGRLGTFRSTKGAALGSSYRTGTCFVRRGQMSPIMSSGTTAP